MRALLLANISGAKYFAMKIEASQFIEQVLNLFADECLLYINFLLSRRFSSSKRILI